MIGFISAIVHKNYNEDYMFSTFNFLKRSNADKKPEEILNYEEVVYTIFQFIPAQQLRKIAPVSKQFKRISSDVYNREKRAVRDIINALASTKSVLEIQRLLNYFRNTSAYKYLVSKKFSALTIEQQICLTLTRHPDHTNLIEEKALEELLSTEKLSKYPAQMMVKN